MGVVDIVFVERGNSFRDENYISGITDRGLHFRKELCPKVGLEFKYGANPVWALTKWSGEGRGLVASTGENDQNFLGFATK